MKRYSNDPYWLTARFQSACTKCQATIKKGDRAFYHPSSRSCLCGKDECGEQASRDFNAAADDEDFMSAGFNGGYGH